MAAVWSSDIPLAKKLYLNVFFFGTRMFATHIVSFFLYCVLIPICATAPEVTIPFWALVYMVGRDCLIASVRITRNSRLIHPRLSCMQFSVHSRVPQERERERERKRGLITSFTRV